MKTCSGKYFISILVETESPIPEKAEINENDALGLDLGLKDFLVTSDGTKFGNPKYLKNNFKKLNREKKS